MKRNHRASPRGRKSYEQLLQAQRVIICDAIVWLFSSTRTEIYVYSCSPQHHTIHHHRVVSCAHTAPALLYIFFGPQALQHLLVNNFAATDYTSRYRAYMDMRLKYVPGGWIVSCGLRRPRINMHGARQTLHFESLLWMSNTLHEC